MKLLVLSFITLLTFISLLYFANKSYESTLKYNQKSKIIIDKLNIVDNLKLKADRVLHELDFKSFDVTQQSKLNKLSKESEHYLTKSYQYVLFYFITILIVSIILFLFEKKLFSLFISLVAIMSLGIAIFTPILLLIIKTPDMIIVGTLSLEHQVQSVVGIVGTLIDMGNYIVAFVVTVVSILIPLIKSLIILIHNILRFMGRDSELHYIIKTIGKWSMVDVLVVAILVVFFTINQNVTTEMIIEGGLYFFLIYILFSILSTYEMFTIEKSSSHEYHRSYDKDFDWEDY